MELNKTPQADLESERITFFLLGFTAVLAGLFVLLEWSSEDRLPPPAWEGFPLVVIENEYTYNEMLVEIPMKTSAEIPIKVPMGISMESGIKPVLPVEKLPNVVYEDYNVVEDVSEENILKFDSEGISTVHLSKESAPELFRREELSEIFTEVEVMPQYPGGYTAMNRFLFNNLKYPASASAGRIEGRVWCSFVVNRDGSLADIRIDRGVHVSLDQEALRVLETMPNWMPGNIRGVPVRVKVYLPIVFKL